MSDYPPPRRHGHKKSASTSNLAVMAITPSGDRNDLAFRDLTNTPPEDSLRSKPSGESRSRMIHSATTSSNEQGGSGAGLRYLPALMSPRVTKSTGLSSEGGAAGGGSPSITHSPSSSRLSRSGHSRKSRLSMYTTSSASDTLHESTEEEEEDLPESPRGHRSSRPQQQQIQRQQYLPPLPQQQQLTPAQIPLPPTPSIRRSATSSTLHSAHDQPPPPSPSFRRSATSSTLTVTDDTPKSKPMSSHSHHRSSRKSTSASATSAIRRSESRSDMGATTTDTGGSELEGEGGNTPKRISSRRKRVDGEGRDGTPGVRSERRKSKGKKSRELSVPMALDILQSLRSSHLSRLNALNFIERSLLEACPARRITEISVDSALQLLRSYNIHAPLLALMSRHLPLIDQVTVKLAEEYLIEMEVALNVLQGMCMLELELKDSAEKACARAMSGLWVFEALVDLLLQLRHTIFNPGLSLKLQLHCVSSLCILLLHSRQNLSSFDLAGGTRALSSIVKDGETQTNKNASRERERDKGVEKMEKELLLKCMEVLTVVTMLDKGNEDGRLQKCKDKEASGTPSTTQGNVEKFERTKAPSTMPQYVADYMSDTSSSRLAPTVHIDSPSRSASALGFRRSSVEPSPIITRTVVEHSYITSTTITSEGQRSSSNSSSGTALTSVSTLDSSGSLLRTPHESYMTDNTSLSPSSRGEGYDSERSDRSDRVSSSSKSKSKPKLPSHGYLAPFQPQPSTPKSSSSALTRTGITKSSSSQGLGYWTPQVKSRSRHDAVDMRDDQRLLLDGGIGQKRPAPPPSSAGFRAMLGNVKEEKSGYGSPGPKVGRSGAGGGGIFGDDLGPLMHSTTKSEVGKTSRTISTGSDDGLAILGEGNVMGGKRSDMDLDISPAMEQSLAKSKERLERQEEARRAASKVLGGGGGTGIPKLPSSKSYIGLGLPGKTRSSTPPEMINRDVQKEMEGERKEQPRQREQERGARGLGSRMMKSSTSMGLSGIAM